MPPECTPVVEADEQMTLKKLEDLADTHNVTKPLKDRRKKRPWLQAFHEHNEILGHPPPKRQPPKSNKCKRPPMEHVKDMPRNEEKHARSSQSAEGLFCKEVQIYLECDDDDCDFLTLFFE